MSGAPGNVKVFLAGEGSNELGSRSGHPSYQSDDRPGVLYALLLRVQPTGWQVIGARDWKSIRKYRAGKASHADTHNVLGAALDAIEAHGDVLVFSRDLDNDSAREAGVNEGIAQIPSISQHLRVIGGVAIPKLEGWILALLGEKGTEELSPSGAEAALVKREVARKDGMAMADVVASAELDKIPPDARSLRSWLSRAQAVLPALLARRAGER